MIDFPNVPVAGDIFKTGNLAYRFDGKGWLSNPPGGAVLDAPSDGKIYGRKDAAWTEVVASSVWVGDAPPADPTRFPLWWSSLTLQLCVWYNDGTSSQWVDTSADAEVVGGSGGSTTQIPDGTIAAPGLAWASEQGLGWYRKGAGSVTFVKGGGSVLALASAGGNSLATLNPTVAGGYAQFALENGIVGESTNVYKFKVDPTGLVISESVFGLGVSKPLVLSFNQIDLGKAGTLVTLPAGRLQFPPGSIGLSPDANTLDDYREGTWTPVAAGGGPAVTVHEATYTKIGRLVTIQAFITIAANTNGGNVQFVGLPFPAARFGCLAIGYTTAPWTGNAFTVMASATTISVYGGAGFSIWTQFSGAQLYFSGSYQA